jgi:outer membrane receptor protein involved in Fe transport
MGRVTDARGKAIPDATVRVQAEGRTAETVTDSRGAYRIEASGVFRLEVQRTGYRTIRSSPASLPSAATEDVYQADVSLLPGSPEDIETVDLRLEEVGNDAETRDDAMAREGLPKADRLFGLRGGVNVTGIREGSGQQWLATTGSVFTSSSISTSVAGTSDFSAELGDTNVHNDALPAGDSTFHGNVHYFVRNDVFNAKNFFDQPDAPIPPFKYHFFGADSGGMIHDGTYFYSQYWGLRIGQSITRAATVPNPALLAGDFSSLPDPLINPQTGFPFKDNRIPADQISTEGRKLAALYPAPNVPNATIQNYRAVGKLQTAADAFGIRIDRRLASSDEVFLEFQFNRDTTNDPFNLLSGITNLPMFGVRDALSTQTLRLNNTHILSPVLVHQLRFSINYLKQPRTILNNGQGALPAILITGYSNIGHAANLPQERRNRSFELLSDFSWQHSTSQTKVGGVIRYFPFHAYLDLYNRGQYQFTGGIFSGNALANLLLGFPTNALRLTGNTTRSFRTWTTSFYVQHDWRALPRLSVNLGLRFDYQSPFREANGRVANFNETTGTMDVSPKSLYNTDARNFGPRFGLSWQPFRSVVARAGYGVFYDTLSAGDSLFLLGLNPPFVDFTVKNNGSVVPQFDLSNAFNDNTLAVQPSIFSTSRHLANPYLQQWNASIEFPVQELFVLNLSYFGQKGTRLRRQLNLNQPLPGPAESLDDRRPFPAFKNIFQFETSASSIAHAGELRMERRFRAGLGLVASYRFSRSIDDATLISMLPQNSHNLRVERGLSDFHMKHRLVFSGTYNLPGRRFAPIRAWQLQAIGTAQSGTPLSAIVSEDISGTGSPIVNRPNLIGNPNIGNITPAQFFDPKAFQIPAQGTFGNSGRNVIIGPGIWNVDTALSRTLRISDATRMQFRMDFYNVFNHPNFVAPPSMQNFLDSPDFGALFVARSPRIVQFGLKFLW